MVVEGEYLYFGTSAGSIRRKNTSNSFSSAELAKGAVDVRASPTLAANTIQFYWVERNTGFIYTASFADPDRVFAWVEGGARAVAADEEYVYWLTDESSHLLMRSHRHSSRSPVPMVPRDSYPGFTTRALHLDANNAYIGMTSSTNGKILRVPKAGGEPTVLADGNYEPLALASDATTLYWTESDGIYAVPIDGGPPERLVECRIGHAVAAAWGAVYWICDGVLSARVDGGSPERLVDGLRYPSRLAVTERSVWYTVPDGSGDALWRLAR